MLESWKNTFGTSQSHTLLEQVKVCAEIWIDCTDDNPLKRPTIGDIICRLNGIDISNSSSTSSTLINGVNIYPLELCFPFEAGKRIECPLSIANMTDRYVNYWVAPQFPNMYTPCKHELVNEIRTGTNNLDPMSTGSFNVTMLEQQQPPSDAGMFKIVMIAMGSRNDLKKLKSSIGDEPKIDGELLKRVKEVGGEEHTAMLRAVICLPSEEGVAPKVSSAYQVIPLSQNKCLNYNFIDEYAT